MRICDLSSGVARLTNAFSQLKDRWGEIKDVWNDDSRRQFEENHLREIPSQMQLILAAAQRLTETLEKAARDCEDLTES